MEGERGRGEKMERRSESSLPSRKALRESGASPGHYTLKRKHLLKVSRCDWSHPAINTAISSESGQFCAVRVKWVGCVFDMSHATFEWLLLTVKVCLLTGVHVSAVLQEQEACEITSVGSCGFCFDSLVCASRFLTRTLQPPNVDVTQSEGTSFLRPASPPLLIPLLKTALVTFSNV